MFFFLKGGSRPRDALLVYLPLPDADKHRLSDRFLSVSRATIKGTLVVGFVQGALCGASFWVVGSRGSPSGRC